MFLKRMKVSVLALALLGLSWTEGVEGQTVFYYGNGNFGRSLYPMYQFSTGPVSSYPWPSSPLPAYTWSYTTRYFPGFTTLGPSSSWPYASQPGGLGLPVYPNNQMGFYSGPLFFPGFAANAVEPRPRMRDSYYRAPVGGIAPASFTAPDPSRAYIEVRLPSSDAEVWFEGVKMGKTGLVREFFSPPLAPGSRYAYEIRVRWFGDAGEKSQTRHIIIRGGERVIVDLTQN